MPSTDPSAIERDNFKLRLHRARSWLNRAVQFDSDDDMAVMSLWIALNAAYAQDMQDIPEKMAFRNFIDTVCDLDAEGKLNTLVWNVFSGPIRSILNNKFVYQPFWDDLNGRGDGKWAGNFEKEKSRVNHALAQKDTARILYTVLVRIYTLRNQLMHGGATWGSSVNRAQVRDARAMLEKILPIVLDIMQTSPQNFSGAPFYPLVIDN